MSRTPSAGARFRQALAEEQPLQIMGTINAYTAIMAEKVGYRAIYLSGGGVANASYGLPDLGMTTMNDVLEDVRRISAASEVPLLVDIDTGWGGAFNIGRTIKEMIKAGAAAVHIEDQVAQKRCGHRPNKEIVAIDEMVEERPYFAHAVIPGGMYRGNAKDVKTFGVTATLVVSAKLDADVVYEVVKAVFDNFDEFKGLHPAFGHLVRKDLVRAGNSAPLHDGAVRYFKENGLL